MFTITSTKKFNKSFKKIDDLIFEKTLLSIERLKIWPPFEKSWNVHKLSWKYGEYYSVNVTWDFRLIFQINKWNHTVLLFDIWSHSKIYN